MRVALAVAVAAIGSFAATTAAAATAPSATTGAGSAGLSCSADVPSHLDMAGTVNPNGQDATWYFQYGADTSYGSQTTSQDAGAGLADVPVTQHIAGVSFGTIHFRLVALNAGGPTYGDDHTVIVSVPPCPPPPLPQIELTVATPTASGSACAVPAPTFSVVVSATVVPARSTSETTGSAYFAYGPAQPYTQATAATTVPWSSASTTPVTVSQTISGLPSGTTHVALVIDQPNGGRLTTGDRAISPTVPPCVPPIDTAPIKTPHARTARVNVRWSLVRVTNHGRSVVIRFRPPACALAKTPAHVSLIPRHGRFQLGVLFRVPFPSGACSGTQPTQTRTIHLPRGVSVAKLRHAAL